MKYSCDRRRRLQGPSFPPLACIVEAKTFVKMGKKKKKRTKKKKKKKKAVPCRVAPGRAAPCPAVL